MSKNSTSRDSGRKRLCESSSQHPGTKILRVDDPLFEEQVNNLLECSDQSDIENDIDDIIVCQSELIENHMSDEDEVVEVEEMVEEVLEGDSSESTSESNVPLSELRRTQYYYGRNGCRWVKTPPNKRVRTLQHNIVSRTTSIVTADDVNDPYVIWKKLIDPEMLQRILTWTNAKISAYRTKFARLDKPELKDTDSVELNAFLGLLFYSAVLKSNHENTSFLFATDGTGCDIFRCCMSEYRFLVLLLCLRFDNPTDRTERLKDDKLAAISQIFNQFVRNCQQLYQLSEHVTIDEMLVKFRGRSHMISYMPKKPGKYGLVIRALCDAGSFYFYNGYMYSGKGSDGAGLSEEEKKLLVPTQCVLRLTKPLQGSNRNVTADNWFSSIELVDELAKKKLTYVGTVKKNKREIPNEFQPQKRREVGSSLFGFMKEKTLCSYVPKKNKAVVLVSSMHHTNDVDTNTNKPEIIHFYNSTKGGVDEADKKCSIYSCSRRTRRWPMVVFYRILDLSGMNAYIIYNMHQGKQVERGDFLKKLARSLVLPHMQRRVFNARLPRELRSTMTRVLGDDMPPEEDQAQVDQPNSRKSCRLCPPKLHRKTAYTCVQCRKPICLQCSRPLCKDCQ